MSNSTEVVYDRQSDCARVYRRVLQNVAACYRLLQDVAG